MNGQRAANTASDEPVVPGDRNADFDMWIRMAADSKINARNSWKFELIDYFEDLSLLKEGEYINFQKASTILDGCVKIYTSRIDYAATEIGKLLSGIATSRNVPRRDESSAEAQGSELEELEGRRQISRRLKGKENTLVHSFEEIKLKKLETELALDPVFKKTLSDFDEGGAKSLLLNTLSVDSVGRHVFDSSISTNVPSGPLEDLNERGYSYSEEDENSIELSDVARLIVGEGDIFDRLSICPSMGELNKIIDQGTIPEELAHRGTQEYDFGPDYLFDDDNEEDYLGDISMSKNESILNNTLQRLFEEADDLESKARDLGVEQSNVADEKLLEYFDNKIHKSSGHTTSWKLRNIIQRSCQSETNPRQNKSRTTAKKTIINFFGEEDLDDDELFASPVASTLIPLNRRKHSARHLLPDDMDLTAKRITSLFTKPIALKTFRKRDDKNNNSTKNEPTTEIEWSQRYNVEKPEHEVNASIRMDDVLEEDIRELHYSYDQSFFDDANIGDLVDPMEGFDMEQRESNIPPLLREGGLNHFLRPDHLNFSRIAKKVDIKRLKEDIWTNVSHSGVSSTDHSSSIKNTSSLDSDTFGLLFNKVGTQYQEEAKTPPSIGLCFICLLHLANEHSLHLESNESNSDFMIKRPATG